MRALLYRLVRETEAQDLAEYGVALAVVGLTSAAATLAIATSVRVLFVRAVQTIVVAVIG